MSEVGVSSWSRELWSGRQSMKKEQIVHINRGKSFMVTTVASCWVSGRSHQTYFCTGAPHKLTGHSVRRWFLPSPWFSMKLWFLRSLFEELSCTPPRALCASEVKLYTDSTMTLPDRGGVICKVLLNALHFQACLYIRAAESLCTVGFQRC